MGRVTATGHCVAAGQTRRMLTLGRTRGGGVSRRDRRTGCRCWADARVLSRRPISRMRCCVGPGRLRARPCRNQTVRPSPAALSSTGGRRTTHREWTYGHRTARNATTAEATDSDPRPGLRSREPRSNTKGTSDPGCRTLVPRTSDPRTLGSSDPPPSDPPPSDPPPSEPRALGTSDPPPSEPRALGTSGPRALGTSSPRALEPSRPGSRLPRHPGTGGSAPQ